MNAREEQKELAWARLATLFNTSAGTVRIYDRIIIGSDRRPEIKQGIEGKNVRFRSRKVRDRDRRWEAINFGAY